MTRLEQMLIDEVSGVDDPANQLTGWMVRKSRSAGFAARVQPDGRVRSVSFPAGMSAEDAAEAMRGIGVDEDTISALGGSGVAKAADDALTAYLTEVIELAEKAAADPNDPLRQLARRHSLRHPVSGQFRARTTVVDGVTWEHHGNVHPGLLIDSPAKDG